MGNVVSIGTGLSCVLSYRDFHAGAAAAQEPMAAAPSQVSSKVSDSSDTNYASRNYNNKKNIKIIVVTK